MYITGMCMSAIDVLPQIPCRPTRPAMAGACEDDRGSVFPRWSTTTTTTTTTIIIIFIIIIIIIITTTTTTNNNDNNTTLKTCNHLLKLSRLPYIAYKATYGISNQKLEIQHITITITITIIMIIRRVIITILIMIEIQQQLLLLLIIMMILIMITVIKVRDQLRKRSCLFLVECCRLRCRILCVS